MKPPKPLSKGTCPQNDGGTHSLRQLPPCPSTSLGARLPPVWSSPPASAPGQSTATGSVKLLTDKPWPGQSLGSCQGMSCDTRMQRWQTQCPGKMLLINRGSLVGSTQFRLSSSHSTQLRPWSSAEQTWHMKGNLLAIPVPSLSNNSGKECPKQYNV